MIVGNTMLKLAAVKCYATIYQQKLMLAGVIADYGVFVLNIGRIRKQNHDFNWLNIWRISKHITSRFNRNGVYNRLVHNTNQPQRIWPQMTIVKKSEMQKTIDKAQCRCVFHCSCWYCKRRPRRGMTASITIAPKPGSSDFISSFASLWSLTYPELPTLRKLNSIRKWIDWESRLHFNRNK